MAAVSLIKDIIFIDFFHIISALQQSLVHRLHYQTQYARTLQKTKYFVYLLLAKC